MGRSANITVIIVLSMVAVFSLYAAGYVNFWLACLGFAVVAASHARLLKLKVVPKAESKYSNDDFEKLNHLVQSSMDRNAEFLSILDGMQKFVISLDKDLIIHECYSTKVPAAFGETQPTGQSFVDYVFASSTQGREAGESLAFHLKGVFGMGKLQWKLTAKSLVREIEIPVGQKKVFFQVGYYPMMTEGKITKIIVFMDDVTEFMGAKKEVSQRQADMEKIYAMLQVPDSIFNLFMKETCQLFDKLRSDMEELRGLSGKDWMPIVARMFRAVHTIKANSKLFKLFTMETVSHKVEDYLGKIRDGKIDFNQDTVSELMTKLMEVNEEIFSYMTLRREVMGRSENKNDINVNYKVQWVRSLLQQFSLAIRESSFNDRDFESIKWQVDRALTSFEKTSILEYINRYDSLIEELASRMLKKVKPIQHTIEYQYFDPFTIGRLNDILVHCIRNSLDHGIETPETRTENGKTEEGLISLETREVSGEIVVKISDNGRGIDLDKVVAKALTLGIISEERAKSLTQEEKMDLIFLPGFSTAEQITDVSGRGVGMDAVRAMAEELDGDARITSTSKYGTSITVTFPEKRDDFLTTLSIYDISQVLSHAIREIDVILSRKKIKVEVCNTRADSHTLVLGDRLYAKELFKNVFLEIATLAAQGSVVNCDINSYLTRGAITNYEYFNLKFNWTAGDNLAIDKNSPTIRQAIHAAERQDATIRIKGVNSLDLNFPSGIPVNFAGYNMNICLFVSDSEKTRADIDWYFQKYLKGWQYEIIDGADPRYTMPEAPSLVIVEADFVNLYGEMRTKDVLQNDSVIIVTNSTRGTEILANQGLPAGNLLFTPSPLSKVALAHLLEMVILRQFATGTGQSARTNLKKAS
jgi:two-component sensor histidine kinase